MAYMCTNPGCELEFDSKRARSIHETKAHDSEKPWTDEEWLREQHHEKGKTAADIADGLDISPDGIRHWIGKHGIEQQEFIPGGHSDAPWREGDRLQRLHHEGEMTPSEIADEWGCSAGTIKRWLRRHEIENRTVEIKKQRRSWADPEELRHLYHDKGYSLSGVAEELGTNREKVRTEMERHGIPRRDRIDAVRNDYAAFGTDLSGYECWNSTHDGESEFLRVHRLLVIADGEDPHKVFSSDHHVHHKNGIKWGNWHSNVELLSPEEHRAKHPAIAPTTRREIAERYDAGVSGYVLSEEYDVARRTISKIHSEFFDGRSELPKRAGDQES